MDNKLIMPIEKEEQINSDGFDGGFFFSFHAEQFAENERNDGKISISVEFVRKLHRMLISSSSRGTFPLYFSTSFGCEDNHSSSCIFITNRLFIEENIKVFKNPNTKVLSE